MNLRRTATAVAVAVAMSSTPVLAQGSADSLAVSTAQTRAGASVDEASDLGGGFIIPLLALAAIIAGILVVLDDDDDPTSP